MCMYGRNQILKVTLNRYDNMTKQDFLNCFKVVMSTKCLMKKMNTWNETEIKYSREDR